MTHKINIPNDSALLLQNIISEPGWAKTVEDIVIGGSILVEIFGEFEPKKITNKKGEEEFDLAWIKATADWEFTEKQRDCARRAMAAVPGKLRSGRASYYLSKAFGYSSE